jgi:type II secretory pathway pseudopilin PulG
MHVARTNPSWERRAFTIIELLTSIFVIGLILAILIVGLQYFFAAGQSTRQRAAVTQMKQAVSDFEGKFGFLPPLVRDQHPNAAKRMSMELVSGQNRIAVTSAADLAAIPMVNMTNPYEDGRYSVRTLPYYLSGGLDLDIRTGTHDPIFPIDGVLGGGSYRPNEDGSFRIPDEVLRAVIANQPPRKLTAEVYLAFIDPGAGDPKLVRAADAVYDGPNDSDPAVQVQFRDAKNVVYRYYRWTALDPVANPTAQNQNIPLMVGNASDSGVRGAKYAIVGAGPNHVFGDEDITLIRSSLGKPLNFPEADARKAAASDNVVEVGQ